MPKLGNTNINKVYLGSNESKKLYLGETLVFDNTSVPVDADAQLFITNAGITNTTQQSAINQLVLDLKSNSIWTKMHAIYPLVGGTASQHKFNLKNPLDTDAAFRLTYSGTVVHSSTGAKSSGGYMITNINPISDLQLNSTHISYYSREDIKTGNYVDMGVSGATSALFLAPHFSTSSKNFRAVNASQTSAGTETFNMASHFIASRIVSTQSKQYRNGVVVNTDSVTSNSLSTFPIIIMGYANGLTSTQYNSIRECAFASVGDGLDDTESLALYNSIQTYQTTLGRQV